MDFAPADPLTTLLLVFLTEGALDEEELEEESESESESDESESEVLLSESELLSELDSEDEDEDVGEGERRFGRVVPLGGLDKALPSFALERFLGGLLTSAIAVTLHEPR